MTANSQMKNLTPGTPVRIKSGGTGVVVCLADGKYQVRLDGGAPWKGMVWPLFEREELEVRA